MLPLSEMQHSRWAGTGTASWPTSTPTLPVSKQLGQDEGCPSSEVHTRPDPPKHKSETTRCSGNSPIYALKVNTVKYRANQSSSDDPLCPVYDMLRGDLSRLHE